MTRYIKTLKNIIVLGVSTFFLTACLIPEKFKAKLEFQSDGSYTFQYVGTVAYAIAAAQIKESGRLSKKDEEGLLSDSKRMAKSPNVKSIAYQGSGRYYLDIQDTKKSGQPLKVLDFFTVKTNQKSSVTMISSPKLDAKSKTNFEKLGLKIDGKLEISLPNNAVVISNNATSTPKLGFGTYSWQIDTIEQVKMEVLFKQ